MRALLALLPLLLLLTTFQPLLAQGTLPTSGTVLDAESGSPIGGAVIRTGAGTRTYTSQGGRFRIPLAPGTRTITASSIGYSDTTISVTAGATDIVVRLRPSSVPLPGVSVKAELTARQIVERAIEQKGENRRKAKTVQGLLYTKSSFDIEGNAFGQLKDENRHGIIETFSRAYYSDRGTRIKVIQRRQTANIPAQSNLIALGDFISFYDDDIPILNTTIPSPLNGSTLSRYDFTLKERTSLNGQTIFVIDAKPATRVLPTFEGTIKIAAETFNLVEVDVRPSKSTAVAFVRDLHVQQKFEKVEGDIWFPTYLNITGAAEVEIVRGIAAIQGKLTATSIFTELQVNEPIPDSVYADEQIIAAAPDADSTRSEFWEGNTLSELTPEEKETYRQVDSLVDASDTTSTRGSIETDLRPYLAFNRVGSIVAGGTFSPRVGPIRLDLLGAYSFGQKRALGSADINVVLLQGDTLRLFRPSRGRGFQLSLQGSVFSRIRTSGIDDGYPEIVTTAAAALFHRDYYDYLIADGWSAGLNLRLGPVTTSVELEESRQRSLSNTTDRSIFIDKAFRPNPMVLEGSFRAASGMLQIGRSENSVVIGTNTSATYGLTLFGLYGEHQGSGTAFRSAEARGRFTLPTIPTGYAPMMLDVGVRAGIGSDNLPPQYQFRMPTSVSFVGRFTSFYSAPTGVYGGTRYGAIFAGHSFSDIIWRAIGLPTYEGRGVEFSVSGAAAYFDNRNAITSPLRGYTSTGGEWYSEAGFGIGRIPTFISNIFFLQFNARWGVGPLGKGKFGAVLELSSPF